MAPSPNLQSEQLTPAGASAMRLLIAWDVVVWAPRVDHISTASNCPCYIGSPSPFFWIGEFWVGLRTHAPRGQVLHCHNIFLASQTHTCANWLTPSVSPSVFPLSSLFTIFQISYTPSVFSCSSATNLSGVESKRWEVSVTLQPCWNSINSLW